MELKDKLLEASYRDLSRNYDFLLEDEYRIAGYDQYSSLRIAQAIQILRMQEMLDGGDGSYTMSLPIETLIEMEDIGLLSEEIGEDHPYTKSISGGRIIYHYDVDVYKIIRGAQCQ